MISRLDHLKQFYGLLGELEHRLRGTRRLSDCSARAGWPKRGVYFFTEPGEIRSDSGKGPRVVRVGTHALKPGAKSTLWSRLRQHKGSAKSGSGNHRGSIFRLIVGAALIKRDSVHCPTWEKFRSHAPPEVRKSERPAEQEVSTAIGAMPFLWLSVDDEPGPDSRRGFIERNSIALLSNYGKRPLDPPSRVWLGQDCNRKRVRCSGLWNSNHVDEDYDPEFLEVLKRLVAATEKPS
ncbi:MAG: hypothetical protein OXN89_19740 [Bryobacterales bacterium]|nr:hypothetical protein [Bryobacterales bacterium]